MQRFWIRDNKVYTEHQACKNPNIKNQGRAVWGTKNDTRDSIAKREGVGKKPVPCNLDSFDADGFRKPTEYTKHDFPTIDPWDDEF